MKENRRFRVYTTLVTFNFWVHWLGSFNYGPRVSGGFSFATLPGFIVPWCRIRMSGATGSSGQLPGTRTSKAWILWLPMCSMSEPGQQLAMETSVSPWRSQPTQVPTSEALFTVQVKCYYIEIQGAVPNFWLGEHSAGDEHGLKWRCL